jgi:coenzyme F420-reducing hydrogenase delta subunit
MCTGRIDLAFILRAFLGGADGVFIGGCWPGECHYVTEGNYDALANVHLGRKLLERLGIDPERLRLEWLSAGEGIRFAEVMNDFAGKLRDLGSLGGGGGESGNGLRSGLEAASTLVPYIKLVQTERLRVPVRSEEAINRFFTGEEFARLFNDLIAEKLAIRRIVSLLEERPLSTGEISERLGLGPSEVSRHIKTSSRLGLVRYDAEQKRYAPA